MRVASMLRRSGGPENGVTLSRCRSESGAGTKKVDSTRITPTLLTGVIAKVKSE
jgi:hypothetical protein